MCTPQTAAGAAGLLTGDPAMAATVGFGKKAADAIPNPHHGMVRINGVWEQKGQQTPQDAEWIRAHPEAGKGNDQLGWGSIAPPQAPDFTDVALKAAQQQQVFGQLAQTGYMATFIGGR